MFNVTDSNILDIPIVDVALYGGVQEREGYVYVTREDGKSGTMCSYLDMDTASAICKFLGHGYALTILTLITD